MSRETQRTLLKTASYGLLSLLLYTLLYLFNEPILEHSREGRWSFIIPVAIAFLFSLVHGNFTGNFWNLVGIRAKTTKK